MFMCRRSLFVVVLVLLTQTSPLMAQPGGRRGGGPPNIDRATALGIPQVRSELKITDDQAATIDAAVEAYREEQAAARPDRSTFSFLTPEEQQDLQKQAAKDIEAISKNTDETLGVLLEPAQLKRLDEMIVQAQLQLAPVSAVRKNLQLSDDQQEKLAVVESEINRKQGEMRSAMMKKFQSGQPVDFGEIRKLIEKGQQEALAAVMTLVTDEQQEKLTSLQGEKFEIDLMSIMRGGGRQRGQRRRGPGGNRSRQ